MNKPILALDFDGCIHRYSKGWQDGSIYDDVVPGFFEWAAEAAQVFTLVIVSSRSATPEGRAAIREWLTSQASLAGPAGCADLAAEIVIQAEKPPAFLTIDDRCVRFYGDWLLDPVLKPTTLRRFKPWTQREKLMRSPGPL